MVACQCGSAGHTKQKGGGGVHKILELALIDNSQGP